MKHYDPLHAPDPTEWLALDEGERIQLAIDYHLHARVKLPDATVHAAFHAVVETQIALGDETPVARTLDRLQAEGLDRHDAVHAIGSVLAGHMYDLMKTAAPEGNPNEAYWKALQNLSAESWRRAR